MFLLLRLALALVVTSRACEAAALGVSGPEGEGGVAPEDLAVIRELEELNEKIHMAEKFTNPEHQPQARVVPLDSVPEEEEFGREEYYESSDDATEIPLVETTASSSSVAVNASVADNEVTSPPLTTLPLTTLPLTSPPTGTTSADLTLLESISTVLSTVTSNTTSVPSSSSISASVTSNTTHVPSTSNISTVSAPPEIGNDIDNAQSTGQGTESNIINPARPEEQRPSNNIAFGEFKANFNNVDALQQDCN
ncbi:uncharacterized protein [Branchiostoma lanceolatum]|uniref:uncharacterized protein n=1 Tax=Branchiostoma lanceolatum TaxID=7740 RepID=UPI0034539673